MFSVDSIICVRGLGGAAIATMGECMGAWRARLPEQVLCSLAACARLPQHSAGKRSPLYSWTDQITNAGCNVAEWCCMCIRDLVRLGACAPPDGYRPCSILGAAGHDPERPARSGDGAGRKCASSWHAKAMIIYAGWLPMEAHLSYLALWVQV